VLCTKLAERKKRARTKSRRHATKTDDETSKDKETTEFADTKKTMNVITPKSRAYTQSELNSSATTLVGSKPSDKLESSQYSSLLSNAPNTFDEDYKKAISTVRKKELPIVETDLYQPIISANSNAQDYLFLLQQTFSSISESREWGPFFELRNVGYANPVLSTMAFWQKAMYNWLTICKDFHDYTSTMFREYWIKPLWLFSRDKSASTY